MRFDRSDFQSHVAKDVPLSSKESPLCSLEFASRAPFLATLQLWTFSTALHAGEVSYFPATTTPYQLTQLQTRHTPAKEKDFRSATIHSHISTETVLLPLPRTFLTRS